LELDCLKNLSVIDTPGLNDPISSRTQRTRQFISQCDAAFFLSRSSYFLDQNDLQLLTSQLPQKGVGRLVLVASQYDSALMDTLVDYGSLEQADMETRAALRSHTAKHVEKVVREMRRSGGSQNIIDVIEQCYRPVFISVVAEMMANKPVESYSDIEKIVQRQLSRYAPVTKEMLLSIGNFSAVRKIFDGLIADKEALLQRKADAFVVTAQSNLRTWLSALQAAEEERQIKLGKSCRQIEQRQLQLSQRINRLQSALAKAMEEYLSPLDAALTHGIFDLNHMQSEWNNPPTRAELEVHTRTRTVSAFRWNHPSTWGKYYKRYFSEETVGEVLDPQEMQVYLTQFWAAASDLCSAAFTVLSDAPPLNHALYHIVDEQFAHSSAVRQPERLNRLVSTIMSMLNLHLPIPPLGPNSLTLSQFSHPVRDLEEQKMLRTAVQSAISIMTNDLRRYLSHAAAAIREAGHSATELLQTELGEEMLAERMALRNELAALQRQQIQCQELLEVLKGYL
ncbi:MAG: hypothetical protein RR315_01295, partial [Oscillospiraceae bacterium]